MIPITATVTGEVSTTDVQLPVNHTIRLTIYDADGCEVRFPLYDCAEEEWVGENDCAEFRIINSNSDIATQILTL